VSVTVTSTRGVTKLSKAKNTAFGTSIWYKKLSQIPTNTSVFNHSNVTPAVPRDLTEATPSECRRGLGQRIQPEASSFFWTSWIRHCWSSILFGYRPRGRLAVRQTDPHRTPLRVGLRARTARTDQVNPSSSIADKQANYLSSSSVWRPCPAVARDPRPPGISTRRRLDERRSV